MPHSLLFPRRFLAGLTALLLLLPLAAKAADFQTSLEKWQQSHQAVLAEAEKLSMAGDTRGANQRLIDLADKDGGAAAAFVVANMLYRSEPAVSYRLHERAFKALPKEPATALEMAMEQHRKGQYEAAIPNYRAALASQLGEQFSSLLADCLVRTGRLKEAVAAWTAAKHGSNHTGIDFAIYEIYGELMPVQRRGDLITAIKAGQRDKLPELILLDLNFDTDWWNSAVFDEALDQDLKFAAQTLGPTDPGYVQLALYAKLARPEEIKDADVRPALAATHLVVGDKAVLPESSRLARAVCELAVRHKAATAAELWQAHEPALRARLARKDKDALHLLCLLAVDTDDRHLTELDRIGWKEWHDTEFAASYLIDLYKNKQLTRPDDPELVAALAASPDNPVLNQLRLELAGKDVTRDMLVAAIKSEYHKLSFGLAIPDSYTLKALFYQLGQKL